jgi:hypothetical protein
MQCPAMTGSVATAMRVGACLHPEGKERNGAPQHTAIKSAFKSAARELLMFDHFTKFCAVQGTFTCLE